jgi:glyoxylase-like metal-dependent hydrolase (beta-lactamase superfamily II)
VAIEVTGHAQKAAWRTRDTPPVEMVRPGIWSIPVPMPDSGLRYVLVYAFELTDGVAIVDAGWPDEAAWTALVSGLESIGFQITDVRYVFITHIHLDHHGLAARVREASGAEIVMHRLEREWTGAHAGDSEQLNDAVIAWLRDRGAPAAAAADMAGPTEDLTLFRSTAAPDRLVEDGDRVLEGRWDLRAIWTPGHTPGHLCFAELTQQVFLSGDHVLPRISPNVSAEPGLGDDPLTDFFEALERTAGFDECEVLPAHEYRFRGLADRCAALRVHHDARLAEMVRVIAAHPGASTWDVAAAVTWSRPWDQLGGYVLRGAVTETLAHLRRLREQGIVRRSDHQVDSWQVG